MRGNSLRSLKTILEKGLYVLIDVDLDNIVVDREAFSPECDDDPEGQDDEEESDEDEYKMPETLSVQVEGTITHFDQEVDNWELDGRSFQDHLHDAAEARLKLPVWFGWCINSVEIRSDD